MKLLVIASLLAIAASTAASAEQHLSRSFDFLTSTLLHEPESGFENSLDGWGTISGAEFSLEESTCEVSYTLVLRSDFGPVRLSQNIPLGGTDWADPDVISFQILWSVQDGYQSPLEISFSRTHPMLADFEESEIATGNYLGEDCLYTEDSDWFGFDIISRHMLTYVEDIPVAMKELANACEPEG